MDIAITIEKLVPTADYFGSVTSNDEAAYAAIQWNDERPKPTWEEILEAYSEIGVEIPSKVTMRQARLALHSAGLLANVEAAINALPEPPRLAARIEWDFSSEVHRDKPFVAMIGAALDLTNAELDELFIEAATL